MSCLLCIWVGRVEESFPWFKISSRNDPHPNPIFENSKGISRSSFIILEMCLKWFPRNNITVGWKSQSWDHRSRNFSEISTASWEQRVTHISSSWLDAADTYGLSMRPVTKGDPAQTAALLLTFVPLPVLHANTGVSGSCCTLPLLRSPLLQVPKQTWWHAEPPVNTCDHHVNDCVLGAS